MFSSRKISYRGHRPPAGSRRKPLPLLCCKAQYKTPRSRRRSFREQKIVPRRFDMHILWYDFAPKPESPRDNCGSERQAKKYVYGVLAISLDQFNILFMRLPILEHAIWTDPITGKECKIEQFYVVPFSSCVGAKINEARYIERDGELNKRTPRTTNARVKQKRINRPARKLHHL